MGKARTFGIGMDYSATSKEALRWAADNIIEEGDRVILIHVQPAKSNHSRKQLFEDTGSPLVPLEEFREINFSKQYGLTNDPEVLDVLDTVSKTKGAKVVAKVYWGDPREKLCGAVEDLKLDSLVVGSRGLGPIKREKLCGAVEDLKLDSLVVGSRGLGPIKRVLLGSVSKYVVTNASCPVTVVKGTQISKP